MYVEKITDVYGIIMSYYLVFIEEITFEKFEFHQEW